MLLEISLAKLHISIVYCRTYIEHYNMNGPMDLHSAYPQYGENCMYKSSQISIHKFLQSGFI